MANEKFKPSTINVDKIEQINIISKYVTTTYCKSENSYFVQDMYKFSNYLQERQIVYFMLNDRKIFYKDSVVDLGDLFYISKFNVKRYRNYNEIIGIFEQKIKEVTNNADLGECFVTFCFGNCFNRSEIVAIIDMFVNIIQCRGVLFLPLCVSLSCAFQIQHCIYIFQFKDYTAIYVIDDYWLYDSFIISKEANSGHILIDDEDFADEYHKVKLTQDTEYYFCKLCDYRHYLFDRIIDHFMTTHNIQGKCECAFEEKELNKRSKNISFDTLKGAEEAMSIDLDHINQHIEKYKNTHGSLDDEIYKRISVLFSREKLKKTKAKIITKIFYGERIRTSSIINKLSKLYMGVEEFLADDSLMDVCIAGANLFNNLELAKECWMTDKEWRNGRIRVLREKVLFNL